MDRGFTMSVVSFEASGRSADHIEISFVGAVAEDLDHPFPYEIRRGRGEEVHR